MHAPRWAWPLVIPPDEFVWWLVAASLAVMLISAVVIPWLLVRMPADYFVHQRIPERRWTLFSGPWHVLVMVVKNLLGAILLLAGAAMLVLPGQGLLTMVVGLLLMDFPGKRRFERWIVFQPRVLRAINWLRHRAGREPLMARLD